MFRTCLLAATLLAPCAASRAADPADLDALRRRLTEGRLELTKLERGLAARNADAPAGPGQWVWAGDLKIRVIGADVRDAVAVDFHGVAGKTGAKELAVRVEVAPTSKTHRVVYSTWQAGRGLTDDRGDRYEVTDGPPLGALEAAPTCGCGTGTGCGMGFGLGAAPMCGCGRRLGGFGGGLGGSRSTTKQLEPGAPPFTDVFYFRPPKAGARELRLTLHGLRDGGAEQYHFRLTSWPVAPTLPAGTAAALKVLDKVAVTAEDKGDRERLRDAAAVLKKMADGPELPQLTPAQQAAEKATGEAAARVAAKRDEVLALEAEVTAGTFTRGTEWAGTGDVRVRVVGAEVKAPVSVDTEGRRVPAGSARLMVRVQIENRSKGPVAYTRWATSNRNPARPAPPVAVLADLHGNRYPSWDVTGGDTVGFEGAVPGGGAKIAAGAVVEDVLSFDVPVDPAGELRLTLAEVPGSAAGAYRIAVAADQWKTRK